jgi:hypothetical protein
MVFSSNSYSFLNVFVCISACQGTADGHALHLAGALINFITLLYKLCLRKGQDIFSAIFAMGAKANKT